MVIRTAQFLAGCIGLSILTSVGTSCSLALSPAQTGGLSNQSVLELDNETSIPVRLAVNGAVVAQAAPRSKLTVTHDQLPGLPWHAEAQTEHGRLLVALEVTGEVERTTDVNGNTDIRGYGARVDLSCGRIDLSYGPPLMGPPPATGPFAPGDCDP